MTSTSHAATGSGNYRMVLAVRFHRTASGRFATELGARIAQHCRNKRELAGRLRKAVAFAADNTQEQWLDRRIGWTIEALEAGRAGAG